MSTSRASIAMGVAVAKATKTKAAMRVDLRNCIGEDLEVLLNG